MKKLVTSLLLILSATAFAADIKISQLPLGSAASSGVNDSFPYVDAAANVTRRLKLSDLINLPSMVATYAPIDGPTFTGTVTAPTFVGDFQGDIILSALTASTVPYINGSKALASSAVTPTELGYLSGVTSAIQTQISAKAPTASPTFTGTVTTPALNVSGATLSTVPYFDASKNLISSSVTPTELGYVSGVTSAIQTQISAKAPTASPTFTGTVTTPALNVSGLTATTVPYLDGSKNLASSAVTPTELGYLSGVTSSVQTQISAKQASGNYITALTGDVTASGPGSVAGTIASSAVTNAKLANMAAHTFKGNNTGSTANAADMSVTQATAELNAMVGDSGSGGTKGLVPAPAAGDAAAGKFLKADGTWAASAGGTVTNIAVTGNNQTSVSGSPITTTGTIVLTSNLPGMIFAFGGSTCPTGSVSADGASLLRAGTYATLFSAISTTWGSADGTHFNVPNLIGRILKGAGTITDGNGGVAATLGTFQDQSTAKNGLANATSAVTGITGTNGTSSISGTVGGSDGTHTHGGAPLGSRFVSNAAGGASTPFINPDGSGLTNNTNSTGSGHGHSFSLTAAAQSWSQSGSGTAAAQTITGDTETRPKVYGVNYCIWY